MHSGWRMQPCPRRKPQRQPVPIGHVDAELRDQSSRQRNDRRAPSCPEPGQSGTAQGFSSPTCIATVAPAAWLRFNREMADDDGEPIRTAHSMRARHGILSDSVCSCRECDLAVEFTSARLRLCYGGNTARSPVLWHARDLRRAFPEMTGISARSLQNMRSLAESLPLRIPGNR